MSENNLLLLAAQVLKARKELDALKNGPAPKSPKIRKVNGQIFLPKNASGKTLRSLSEFTEEEIAQFKAKNLLKRANDLRSTADYHMREAAKLEKMAQELCPGLTIAPEPPVDLYFTQNYNHHSKSDLVNPNLFTEEEMNTMFEGGIIAPLKTDENA